MSTYNAIMSAFCEILTFPFKALPPIVGLTVISLVSGVLLLLLYKHTSPQKTIKKIKDRIKGGLLEIRLFKDDLGIVTRAIGGLFLKNIPSYMGCNLIPLVPLVVIVGPLLFQLDARYGFAPFEAGDSVVIEIGLAEGTDPVTDKIRLELPAGLTCEAGPVRIPSRRSLTYRIRVVEAGTYDLKLSVNGRDYIKRLDAAERTGKISGARFNAGQTWDLLENPGDDPWPADAPVESFRLRTQPRAAMLGIEGDLWPWLWIFCIVGLAFGFALKGVLKVTI
jgi:hypothetical protein